MAILVASIIVVIIIFVLLWLYMNCKKEVRRYTIPIVRRRKLRYIPSCDEPTNFKVPSMTSKIMDMTDIDFDNNTTESNINDGPHNPSSCGIPSIKTLPPREDVIRDKGKDITADCSDRPTDCSDLLFCPKGYSLGDPSTI